MADSPLRLPSGQGGLTRYSDSTLSKVQLSPGMVVILCLIVLILVLALEYVGSRWLG